MCLSSCSRSLFVTFAAGFLLCPACPAQQPNEAAPHAASEQAVYADNPDGLRNLLLHILEVARSGDTGELRALIKTTEIPEPAHWFPATFGKEKGESWADPYQQNLEANEAQFQEHMLQLAGKPGDVFVRKLDATKMYDTLKRPVNLFSATWNAPRQAPDPIGYFFFIDGGFRWDSTITFVHVRIARRPSDSDRAPIAPRHEGGETGSTVPLGVPGRDGVSYPTCSNCPAAEFPKGKRHSKANVTVEMKAIIDTDGHAQNIQILRSGGSDFDQKAIEAVQQWQLKPALGASGQPVAVVQVIEITFHR